MINLGHFRNKIKYIACLPIKFYRYFISPIFPSCCRFTPTCSEYAIEAIQTHGVFKGVYLSVKRIAKCNPLGKSGYDPVPNKIEKNAE